MHKIKIVIFRRQKLAEREEFTKSKASSSLLSEDSSDLAGVRYRPKTRETKSTYDVLLSFIQAAIGDQVSLLNTFTSSRCKTFHVFKSVLQLLKMFLIFFCNKFYFNYCFALYLATGYFVWSSR